MTLVQVCGFSSDKAQGGGYTYAVDYWALGVLLAEMLSGEQLDVRPSIYHQGDQPGFDMLDHVKLPSHVSATARSLTAALLEEDPRRRLGSSQSPHGALRDHAFFNVGRQINWKLVDQCSHESINSKISVGKKSRLVRSNPRGAMLVCRFTRSLRTYPPIQSLRIFHLNEIQRRNSLG